MLIIEDMYELFKERNVKPNHRYPNVLPFKGDVLRFIKQEKNKETKNKIEGIKATRLYFEYMRRTHMDIVITYDYILLASKIRSFKKELINEAIRRNNKPETVERLISEMFNGDVEQYFSYTDLYN